MLMQTTCITKQAASLNLPVKRQHQVAQTSRASVRVFAEARGQPTNVKAMAVMAKTKRILPLLSELTAIQAINTSFETLAGRSAMLGVAIAASIESAQGIGEHGVFGNGSHDLYTSTFLSVGLFLVTCSAAVAAVMPSSRTLGSKFLEAVVTSLTSKERSKGSVSNKDVDLALDSAMESVFNAAFVRNYFVNKDDVNES